MWGNGTSILCAKGTDFQDPELVHGLQPKIVAVECPRLSHPRITPDGWSKEAVKDFSTRWQTIKTPEGKDLRLRMGTGQTQYSSRFVTEVKGEAAEPVEEPIAYWGEATEPGNAVVRPDVVDFQPPEDQPAQARDSLTKTVPKARIIPNK